MIRSNKPTISLFALTVVFVLCSASTSLGQAPESFAQVVGDGTPPAVNKIRVMGAWTNCVGIASYEIKIYKGTVANQGAAVLILTASSTTTLMTGSHDQTNTGNAGTFASGDKVFAIIRVLNG
ncbi:MAG TPA: hypothetical protein VM597_35690, partial [Gemmataceae bacterium]|nr:hypothetical protein [Gemmataceae bacterium]